MSYYEEYDYHVGIVTDGVDAKELKEKLERTCDEYECDLDAEMGVDDDKLEISFADEKGNMTNLSNAATVKIRARGGEVGGYSMVPDDVMEWIDGLGNGTWAVLKYDSDFGARMEVFGAAEATPFEDWTPKNRLWYSGALANLYLRLPAAELARRVGVPEDEVLETLEWVDEDGADLASAAYGRKADFAFKAGWDFTGLEAEELEDGTLELRSEFMSCHDVGDATLEEFLEFEMEARAAGGSAALDYDGGNLLSAEGFEELALDEEDGRPKFRTRRAVVPE